MKSVIGSIVGAAAAGVLVGAEEPVCCPAIKVIEAVVDDGGDTMSVRLRRRLEDPDAECVAGRASIGAFTDTDKWVKTGGQTESIFSRFVVDAAGEESYWTVEGGGSVPVEQRVVVVSPVAEAAFRTSWYTNAAAGTGPVCEDGVNWQGGDFAGAIAGHKAWVVIRAPKDDTTWSMFASTFATGTAPLHCVLETDGPNTCRVGVVSASDDFFADVLAGLRAAETVENPFADACEVCEPTVEPPPSEETTTTTGAPVPVPSEKTEEKTEAPGETEGEGPNETTKDEAGGAGRMAAAGAVPLLLAAVVAMVV